LDILGKTRLSSSKPVETPTNPNVKLRVNQRKLLSNPENIVTWLASWIISPSLSISFEVSVVGQFMTDPCHPHWEAILQVVNYLNAHLDQVEAFTASYWNFNFSYHTWCGGMEF